MIYAKYDAMDIAEYMLWYCEVKLSQPINNLKLNKMLYYAQGLYMVEFDELLFDNDMECWSYGVSVPDVYYSYNRNMSYDILGSKPTEKFLDKVTQEELDLFNLICEVTRPVCVWKLVDDIKNDNCYKSIYVENLNLKPCIFTDDLKKDFLKRVGQSNESC